VGLSWEWSDPIEKGPFKKTLKIGDFVIPRVLSREQTRFFPEVFNETIERLGEHSDSLEKRFTKMVHEEQKKYWANVVGVLGVVVSVMALININRTSKNSFIFKLGLLGKLLFKPCAITFSRFGFSHSGNNITMGY